MPGITAVQWTSSKEFTFTKALAEDLAKDYNYIETKNSIITNYGEKNLRKSWLKTCRALKSITEELETRGNEVMPILSISDILANSVPLSTKDEIKKRGAFIFRRVIPQKETEAAFAELKEYVYGPANKGKVGGWPEATPSILRLYNSPMQNELEFMRIKWR